GPDDLTAQFPFSMAAAFMLRDYRIAQFYSGLTVAQRNELLDGLLPYTALTPKQQEQALYLAPALRWLLRGTDGKDVRLGVKWREGFAPKIALAFTMQ